MSHPWMKRHREFLAGVDGWFAAVRRKHSDQMQCGRDVTAFIASVVADFEDYWKRLIRI